MSDITVDWLGGNLVRVTIRTAAYRHVGEHWRRCLTGKNAKNWGRIWIDPSKSAAERRRANAMWEEGESTRGMPQANRDECPGAMFETETGETSDVEVCCATANQAFGRDLYNALRSKVLPLQDYGRKDRMRWWEVKFQFI